MIRQTHIHKAYWILQNFSPSQIQAFTAHYTPVKYGREKDSVITMKVRKIKGSGIPASTIARFQDHTFTPKEKSLKKLSALYERFHYHNLRSYGASTKDARRYCKDLPDAVANTVHDYKKWASRIQQNYRSCGKTVDLEYIRWGMAHSIHTRNDWEMISKFSGLRKKSRTSRKSRRPRQYEH